MSLCPDVSESPGRPFRAPIGIGCDVAQSGIIRLRCADQTFDAWLQENSSLI